MNEEYDFSGLATKNDILCADGRTIRKGAFDGCDGMKVPLVWNHRHDSIKHVLGHAILKVVHNGVRAFCKFNDTVNGQDAKTMIKNKDLESLSIWANQLKEDALGNVMYGVIREVSLVLAGANPGAIIDRVAIHGDDDNDGIQAYIYCDQPLELIHSDDDDEQDSQDELKIVIENSIDGDDIIEPEELLDLINNDDVEIEEEEEQDMYDYLEHADDSMTLEEVIDTMDEQQKKALCAIVGMAISDEDNDDEEEGGGAEMKHNLFESDEYETDFLSHAAEGEILSLAKSSSVGSLKDAIKIYSEQNNVLAHGFEEYDSLFPDYKNITPGAPELITPDLTWVDAVIAGTHKSPNARIKTRQANVKVEELRAKGYKKGDKKKLINDVNLIKRTTDPQTVYVKDALDRDDIVDITDFSIVDYNWNIMKMALNETVAMAIMVGDQREDTDPDKIKEDKIRPIWKDHELYTMHHTVDIEGQKKKLQGTNTNLYFSDNFVYAEAIIETALHAREQYKGSGSVVFFCTPHLVNVMLLARDRNGRRIYETISDLTAALNVTKIETAEQFAGLKRTTSIAMGDAEDGKVKELVGIFVNLKDYQVGSTKGGEITRFTDFDIDFNQEKYLIETRLSGALIKPKSAIALEIDVTEEAALIDDEEV